MMRPSTKPTCSLKAMWKLALLVLLGLLPLLPAACASTEQLAQKLEQNHGTFLTPLPSKRAPQPTDHQAIKPADNLGGMTADELMADPPKPLKVCSAVPADDLQDMRGGQGVYLFNYNLDINLLNPTQPIIQPTLTGEVPGGNGEVSLDNSNLSGMSVDYQDGTVHYTAGPTSSGLGSTLLVSGQDIIAIANAHFNINIPNPSVLIPTVNVMPGASLTGLGAK